MQQLKLIEIYLDDVQPQNLLKERTTSDDKGDTHSLTTSGITSESLGRRSLAFAQAPFDVTFLLNFQNPGMCHIFPSQVVNNLLTDFIS